MNLEGLTDAEIEELYELIEQEERERVSPRFEEWRKHYTYKIAHGGRGAGAKTQSAISLAVQFGENPDYFGDKVNILITREIQSTIDLSSFETVQKKIRTLGYSGWKITKNYIENTKNGSRIAFRGFSDLTADNLRSLEDIDIFIAEEAHNIGYKAWETALPSIRKKGSEVWVLFNRVKELDPCYDLFVKNERPNSCILELRPGNIDNPWFDESELPEKREADYKRDPDEAAHIWEGLPRKQGENSVMSRVQVAEAMGRIADDTGAEECGVDVARYGSDSTQMYRRKGYQITGHDEIRGADTMTVARRIWDFIDHRRDIPVKVDGGYNPGVIDALRELGARVAEINFGGSPVNKEKYANCATEMWFEFPVKEAGIPNDPELKIELTDRRFEYRANGQKIVEAKERYKNRNGGKSPDRADALILCFYQGKTAMFSEEAREQMRALRQRR